MSKTKNFPKREQKKEKKKIEKGSNRLFFKKINWTLPSLKELEPKFCPYLSEIDHELIVCPMCLGFPDEDQN